jgi:hypothetical protein
METNSPKIYFITKDNKFYNSRDSHWYENIVHANYERKRELLDQLIKIDKFIGSSVYVITEEELMNEFATMTTDLVIAGEYFSRLIEKYAFKIPTISQVNKTMYQKCKQAIECLKPFSSMHKGFLEQKEDLTDDVSGYYGEYLQSVATVKIYQTKEISSMIEAYHLDRSSMLGITKKILTNKIVK